MIDVFKLTNYYLLTVYVSACVLVAKGEDMGKVRLPCIHCGRVMSPSHLVRDLSVWLSLSRCCDGISTDGISISLFYTPDNGNVVQIIW